MDDKVRWLAELGKDNLVPQLLAMRWAARTKVDPVAQAIAYEVACMKRRHERTCGALLLFGGIVAFGYFALTIITRVSFFGGVSSTPAWFTVIGMMAVGAGFIGTLVGGLMAFFPLTQLPARDEGEAFAADMQSIESWIGPANSISDWRTGHANMRKYAEALLVRQAGDYEKKRRGHKRAENDKLRAVLLIEMGKAINELHTRLGILNRHQLSSLDPDEYLAEARKHLPQEKDPADGAAEAAPSDTGLAALAPMPDELPAQR